MRGIAFYRLCLLYFVTQFILVPASSLASAKQFLVAVDIGHSKSNVGATSATGIGEYDFNQSLAKLLLSRGSQDGQKKFFLINEGGDSMPLAERSKAAEAMGADLLLSIHHDSVQQAFLTPWTHKGRDLFYCDLFSGFSVFYSEINNRHGRSLQFAKLLGEALVEHNFSPSQHHAEMMMIKGEGKAVIDALNGVFRYDKFAVLKNAKMPAVLLECGIIINREEEKRLRDEVYKERMVSAVLKSIDAFSKAGRQ